MEGRRWKEANERMKETKAIVQLEVFTVIWALFNYDLF